MQRSVPLDSSVNVNRNTATRHFGGAVLESEYDFMPCEKKESSWIVCVSTYIMNIYMGFQTEAVWSSSVGVFTGDANAWGSCLEYGRHDRHADEIACIHICSISITIQKREQH